MGFFALGNAAAGDPWRTPFTCGRHGTILICLCRMNRSRNSSTDDMAYQLQVLLEGADCGWVGGTLGEDKKLVILGLS